MRPSRAHASRGTAAEYGRYEAGTAVDSERLSAALQALVASLNEAPDFNSEHVGGVIGLAVMRAQMRRDSSAAAQDDP